jgi:perosamine synthetase
MTLKVRKFPKGSEVIMTSVNLPDMVRMVKEHGLIPVPLDLDPRTMGPISVEKMRELVTPKVRKLA